ncbi:ABC transporter substrate-binding protein [Aristaeella lactis]|uniref:Raffinose/stachyose/melibiose transport system substrate-binding protein n=1 Tax=Aristaeella lactis TaxID=3046383 RepID=A0AC61PQQ3_9FIRM|nr:extracellular solute-binding protein [Aristaeella lactis]QUA52386.1 extracellular solute-binding protein [Aristaeella lactis]SMC92763.1 raffinose/stachyose/melibiose transport system substrate-binding protein [Aristaeella lactis]
MKKALSLVLALVLLLSVTSVFAEEEKTTLTLWCIATESDSNRIAYEKAIPEIEEAFNVKIEWEAFENDSYKTKIKSTSAEELPDIFFTWAGAFCGDFATAGKVYCLDEAYAEYADALPDVMTKNATYDGKRYAVPLTMNIVAMFANMDLLAEVGYDKVPETYEDLIACCDALKAKGIIPFGCSGNATWCVTEYLEPIIEKTIGYEELGNIFAGKSTWNNPAIATAVDNFQKMVMGGYFDPAGVSLDNDTVKANFIAGKYAFYQNGTWNCGDIAKKGDNFKVALFPVMDAEKATYAQVIGGPADSLAVSANGKNPELAAKVAFALGKKICQYSFIDAGSGLPAWTPDYDTSAVNYLTTDVAAMVAAADGMVLFGDTAMSADPANVYLSYVAKVYGCEIDGAGFIEALANELQ